MTAPKPKKRKVDYSNPDLYGTPVVHGDVKTTQGGKTYASGKYKSGGNSRGSAEIEKVEKKPETSRVVYDEQNQVKAKITTAGNMAKVEDVKNKEIVYYQYQNRVSSDQVSIPDKGITDYETQETEMNKGGKYRTLWDYLEKNPSTKADEGTLRRAGYEIFDMEKDAQNKGKGMRALKGKSVVKTTQTTRNNIIPHKEEPLTNKPITRWAPNENQYLQNTVQKTMEREKNLYEFKEGVISKLHLSKNDTRSSWHPVEVLKMGARLPIEVATVPVTMAGRVYLFGEALSTKEGRKVAVSNIKEIPKGAKEMYNLKEPEGWANFGLTLVGLRYGVKASQTKLVTKGKPPRMIGEQYHTVETVSYNVKSPKTIKTANYEITTPNKYVTSEYSIKIAKPTVAVAKSIGKSNYKVNSINIQGTQYTTISKGNYYMRSIRKPTGNTITKIYKKVDTKPRPKFYEWRSKPQKVKGDKLIKTVKHRTEPDIIWTENAKQITNKNTFQMEEFRTDVKTSIETSKGIANIKSKYQPQGVSVSTIKNQIKTVTQTPGRETHIGKAIIDLEKGTIKPSSFSIDFKRTKYEYVDYVPNPKHHKMIEVDTGIFADVPTTSKTTQTTAISKKFVIDYSKTKELKIKGNKPNKAKPDTQFIKELKQNIETSKSEILHKHSNDKPTVKTKVIEETIQIQKPKVQKIKTGNLEYTNPATQLKPTQTVVPITKAKSKQVAKPIKIEKIVQRMNVKTGTKEKLLFKELIKTQPKIKAKQENKIINRIRSNQEQTIKQTSKVQNMFRQSIKQSIKQKQKTHQRVKQTQPKTSLKPNSIRNRLNYAQVKQTFYPIPKSFMPSINTMKHEGFNVFTKKFGTITKINMQPLPKTEAINFGAYHVGNTARASFWTEPAGERATGSFSKKGILSNFYKKGMRYIEKRGKRIKSKGELEEITYKGIMSKTKKNNWIK